MRRSILSFLTVVGILSASTSLTLAQTYDISWHTIAGGGGTSSGGTYTVTGTIGQPAAGNLSGGAYTLTGGFWGIIAAVQTPGAPLLTIASGGGPNHVVISWPATATGFVLQQDPTLGNVNWANVNTTTFPILVTNGVNNVVVPVSGNQYFRLINP
jgi:hypothetical protein